jgi:hypothetical protein
MDDQGADSYSPAFRQKVELGDFGNINEVLRLKFP